MLNKSLLLATKPKPKQEVEYGGAHWTGVTSFYLWDTDNERGEWVDNSEAVNPWVAPTAKGPYVPVYPGPFSWFEVAFFIDTDGYVWDVDDYNCVPAGQGCLFTVYDENGDLYDEYEEVYFGNGSDGVTGFTYYFEFGYADEESNDVIPVGEWTINAKLKVGNKLVKATAIIDFQSPS